MLSAIHLVVGKWFVDVFCAVVVMVMATMKKAPEKFGPVVRGTTLSTLPKVSQCWVTVDSKGLLHGALEIFG